MAKLAIEGGVPVCSGVKALSWPPVSEECAEKLKQVYLSRVWSFNKENEQAFAKEYAAYHGAKHGIFMANGTVTLQCALGALGVGPGDEVIVPALTWMATAMAVRYVGAKPVFADIEPTTLCLDPEKTEAAITKKTKAIIPVHIYGGMADLDRLGKIAKKHGLFMIEDCAHMQGGKWNGRGVGSWGDIGSFSFQQSKTLSSGEGGICLTNDDRLAERLFRSKHIGYYIGEAQGQAGGGLTQDLLCHNFRGTEFQAVILRDQLKGLEALIEKYNRAADKIRALTDKLPGVRVQAKGRLASPQGYYALVLLFDEPPMADIPIATIRKAITAEGLSAGGTYGPVYKHPLFNLPAKNWRAPKGGCPVADTIATGRDVVFGHPFLGADETNLNAILEIIAKVVENADRLRQLPVA